MGVDKGYQTELSMKRDCNLDSLCLYREKNTLAPLIVVFVHNC